MELAYRIPVVGGFCAPTESTDTSCYRHVSNEYTLPASDLFPQIGCCVESSFCCRKFGEIGLDVLTPFRKPIFCVLLLCNFASLVLGIVAALVISSSYSTLKVGHWTSGDVEWPTFDGAGDRINLHIFWGTNTQFIEVNCADFSDQTSCQAAMASSGFTEEDDGIYALGLDWEENACGSSGLAVSGLRFSDIMETACEECKDSQFAVFGIIVSIIVQVPTMATDCQRSTEFGDVNCQKFLGVASNVFSLLANIASILTYRSACYSDLEDSYEYAGETYKMDWYLGAGWRCLMVTMIVKVIDATGHLLIKTPSSRSRPMTGTLVEYLKGDVIENVKVEPNFDGVSVP
mmetsp:Transcript_5540/g.15904  ORF Transcript_5540/g.15904 Transcript_5540/m.15904 type:complete len:346 (-) Transcript_5540:90-1127(-)